MAKDKNDIQKQNDHKVDNTNKGKLKINENGIGAPIVLKHSLDRDAIVTRDSHQDK